MLSFMGLVALLGLGSGSVGAIAATAGPEPDMTSRDEYLFRVDVPAHVAYDNVLRKARECWPPIAEWPFPASYAVETNGYDLTVRAGQLRLRRIGKLITVIDIQALTEESTELKARVVGPSGESRLPSERDLRFLDVWATGKQANCQVPRPPKKPADETTPPTESARAIEG